MLPNLVSNGSDTPDASKSLQRPSAATPILRKIITQMESEYGWVLLGALGTHLTNLSSDYDPRTYGFRKLSDLVRKTDAFELAHGGGKALRIRMKPPGKQEYRQLKLNFFLNPLKLIG